MSGPIPIRGGIATLRPARLRRRAASRKDMMVLLRDLDSNAYRNYRDRNSRDFWDPMNQGIGEMCGPTPEELIVPPGVGDASLELIFGNSHAGDLYRSVKDHAEELAQTNQAAADTISRLQAQVGPAAGVDDIISQNPSPEDRAWFVEMAERYFDCRLRELYTVMRRAGAFEAPGDDGGALQTPAVLNRVQDLHNFVHGADLATDVKIARMPWLDARHGTPEITRIFLVGLELYYGDLKLETAEWMLTFPQGHVIFNLVRFINCFIAYFAEELNRLLKRRQEGALTTAAWITAANAVRLVRTDLFLPFIASLNDWYAAAQVEADTGDAIPRAVLDEPVRLRGLAETEAENWGSWQRARAEFGPAQAEGWEPVRRYLAPGDVPPPPPLPGTSYASVLGR